MDKSWILNKFITKEEYIRGVLSFLNFAFSNSSENGEKNSPAKKVSIATNILGWMSMNT
jgi:hypothetical protein